DPRVGPRSITGTASVGSTERARLRGTPAAVRRPPPLTTTTRPPPRRTQCGSAADSDAPLSGPREQRSPPQKRDGNNDNAGGRQMTIFDITSEERDLANAVEKVCSEILAPRAASTDENEEIPREQVAYL